MLVRRKHGILEQDHGNGWGPLQNLDVWPNLFEYLDESLQNGYWDERWAGYESCNVALVEFGRMTGDAMVREFGSSQTHYFERTSIDEFV